MNVNWSDFRDLVFNVTSSRAELFRRLIDPRRNIDDECGYLPISQQIDKKDYKEYYDRFAPATRVVNVLPDESWKAEPTVFETEDVEEDTEFEKRWRELSISLRGDSHYKKQEGSAVWEYLHRVDRLSGIGRFGCLLFGINDGKRLDEPVEGIDANGRAVGVPPERKLLYLRAFDESLVEISQYNQDDKSPRYGQPELYQINFTDPYGKLETKNVHWTRVLHVVDNMNSSEIFGVPRQQPVFNNLTDLRKLYGGSSEMYWRGAFPGISIETHPQLGGDVNVDVPGLRDSMENYMNGLQRYLTLMGMSAKSLAPQVVDPTAQINVQLEVLCILLGMPKRIFTGSERGELASDQDDSTWNERLNYRRNSYLTPRVIVSFVDRCILLGVLPVPGEEGYSVSWPDLDTLSETEQATVAGLRTDAIVKYLAGGGENLIPPSDFLHRILYFNKQEVDEILEGLIEPDGSLIGGTEEEEEGDENLDQENDPGTEGLPSGFGK